MKSKPLRAIDMYSGVGGWSLGLRLAGIEVVKSYERWEAANRTNAENNGHSTETVDIRTLDLSTIPKNIDLVVGSPPCTQFSFSNRGGSGDIRDGLEDIKVFLAVVDHVQPKWWVMENVPRAAAIIEKELGKGGRLARFRHLGLATAVFNMEDYGLPQRRRRCLAGNIDFERLRRFAQNAHGKTLGDVVTALQQDPVVDPLYGISLKQGALLEHDPEAALSPEELRINRASKQLHPIYNAMPFPDSTERAARTITATCTRVSRESVVIESPEEPNRFRRLTARERACLQGFPVTYQFYGQSYAQKLRMIGNAVPPSFAFYVGLTMTGQMPETAPSLATCAKSFKAPAAQPRKTLPETAGKQFPPHRTFRFAVPSLRLKSGVRFELANNFTKDGPPWRVDFYFGSSKSIHVMTVAGGSYERILSRLSPSTAAAVATELGALQEYLRAADLERMQEVWARKSAEGTQPFELLDRLSQTGLGLSQAVRSAEPQADAIVAYAIRQEFGGAKLARLPMVLQHAPMILAGFLTAGLTNREIGTRISFRQPESRRVAV